MVATAADLVQMSRRIYHMMLITGINNKVQPTTAMAMKSREWFLSGLLQTDHCF